MYVSASLAAMHDLDPFDSGEPELDDWLRRSAATAREMRTSRTFVWTDGDRVVAYYSISAHLIERDSLRRRTGRGAPMQIPAVLLGKLALHQSLHGKKLGSVLLADALGRIVLATQTVAARFVVVDALQERAARFYEHHGFQPIPDSERLIRRVSDVAADLDS